MAPTDELLLTGPILRSPTATSATTASRNSPPDGRIADARAGDTSAFAHLYDAHVSQLYAVCMGLTSDPTTAAELVQDTFVRAWEHLPTFRGECAFGTWLHRIAVNQHLMNERSGRRRARRVSLMTDLPDPLENGTESTATPAPGPSSDPALRMDIEQAIARLPEGARTVFVLREIAGYSHAEIAAQLSIAEGTSKAHLFRARRLLQAFLQP